MPGRENELNEKQTRAKYTLEFKQEAVRQVKAGRAAAAEHSANGRLTSQPIGVSEIA
jgi:transposase-like protein